MSDLGEVRMLHAQLDIISFRKGGGLLSDLGEVRILHVQIDSISFRKEGF